MTCPDIRIPPTLSYLQPRLWKEHWRGGVANSLTQTETSSDCAGARLLIKVLFLVQGRVRPWRHGQTISNVFSSARFQRLTLDPPRESMSAMAMLRQSVGPYFRLV